MAVHMDKSRALMARNCRSHIKQDGSVLHHKVRTSMGRNTRMPAPTSRRSHCPWYLRDSHEAPPLLAPSVELSDVSENSLSSVGCLRIQYWA